MFQRPPKYFPNFKNGLTKDNIKFIDYPGFYDTRGTNYEVITNYSIDRSMEAFKCIPGFIVIIPYQNIIADRARNLLQTLVDTESKFPNLLKNQNLQSRIYFAVTKYGEIGID